MRRFLPATLILLFLGSAADAGPILRHARERHAARVGTRLESRPACTSCGTPPGTVTQQQGSYSFYRGPAGNCPTCVGGQCPLPGKK